MRFGLIFRKFRCKWGHRMACKSCPSASFGGEVFRSGGNVHGTAARSRCVVSQYPKAL